MSHSRPRGTEHTVSDAQVAETVYLAFHRAPHGVAHANHTGRGDAALQGDFFAGQTIKDVAQE